MQLCTRPRDRIATSFVFFTPELSREIERRGVLASGLRQAMARNELQLVYQSQAESGSGRIVGCDALFRRHRPGDESGSPDVSIPAAEKFGLIEELTNWVLERACRDKVAWIGMGVNVARVFLNVSGGLARLQAFYHAFQGALCNHGLQVGDFGVDLTENSLVKGSDPVIEIDRLCVKDAATNREDGSIVERSSPCLQVWVRR